MTALEVAFRYGKQPGAVEMGAIDSVREVYGVRRVVFNQLERTVRVEYDASRLSEAALTSLLRRAGLDLQEKLALA